MLPIAVVRVSAQAIALDDEPDLLNFLVSGARH